ncbi:hypothetical protein [Pseudomonas sp. zbq_11]|uniref:hypothetical protein n=1 Tax=unclassified Pseudomonas TaxID=196821 RepID=UPI00370AF07E
MRTRGPKYWNWADSQLHCRVHEEVLSDGKTLDVQTRLSATGDTQMFIGVYAGSGKPIYEEVYGKRPGETMTRALAWGVERARRVAAGEKHVAA